MYNIYIHITYKRIHTKLYQSSPCCIWPVPLFKFDFLQQASTWSPIIVFDQLPNEEDEEDEDDEEDEEDYTGVHLISHRSLWPISNCQTLFLTNFTSGSSPRVAWKCPEFCANCVNNAALPYVDNSICKFSQFVPSDGGTLPHCVLQHSIPKGRILSWAYDWQHIQIQLNDLRGNYWIHKSKK